MKKPIHGDELTIRYKGETLRATCNDVTEMPKRGAGFAMFTIFSKTIFQRGTEAALLEGERETPVSVERVTAMPHKRMNIVSLSGQFGDGPSLD